jgi:hypothetical protein
VKAASIGAISAVVVVAFILVFVGMGTTQQAEQPTDYKKLLEDGIESKAVQPFAPEETNYQKTLEESATSESAPPVQPTEECDPSYPTVCIAPYPPDLNCIDISYSNFQVFAPDPHGFDADFDGIGCEK